MPTTYLFSPEPMAVIPDPQRKAPSLWVKRLTIVPDRQPEVEPIRDIEFRAGLNIICTAVAAEGETNLVGHSVGKTLLTRLLRYSLGESPFISKSIRSRLQDKLPTGYVIMHVEVAGVSWIVARPLRQAPPKESYAIQADDWRAALRQTESLGSYSNFIEAVSQVTVGKWGEFRLPSANRTARWQDLLSWLARDQGFGLLAYNEWNAHDTDGSSAKLSRDDASLLMQQAMDLLDKKEKQLKEKHEVLLAERKQQTQQSNELDGQIKHHSRELAKWMDMPDESSSVGMFSKQASEQAIKTKDSLERLWEERRSLANIDCLNDVVLEVTRNLTKAVTLLEQKNHLLEEKRTELNQPVPMSMEEHMRTVHPAAKCSASPCPLRDALVAIPPDPEKSERRVMLRQDIKRLTEETTELDQKMPMLVQMERDKRQEYYEAKRRLETELQGIEKRIGRQELLIEQVQSYEQSREQKRNVENRLYQLTTDIEASLTRQESLRVAHAHKRQRISGYYDHVLRRLLGSNAGGKIVLDARGLHPEPELPYISEATALTTLSTVLGLDLACLFATVCGVGFLPGLLIHDSPKEADMEGTLYDRLFRLIVELEAAFCGQPLSFQYIVTTTTPPPTDIAKQPYVRLSLDARNADELLLKTRF